MVLIFVLRCASFKQRRLSEVLFCARYGQAVDCTLLFACRSSLAFVAFTVRDAPFLVPYAGTLQFIVVCLSPLRTPRPRFTRGPLRLNNGHQCHALQGTLFVRDERAHFNEAREKSIMTVWIPTGFIDQYLCLRVYFEDCILTLPIAPVLIHELLFLSIYF